jgi:hypothetical protein
MTTLEDADIEAEVHYKMRKMHRDMIWGQIGDIEKKISRLKVITLIPFPAIPSIVLLIMGVHGGIFSFCMVLFLLGIQITASVMSVRLHREKTRLMLCNFDTFT